MNFLIRISFVLVAAANAFATAGALDLSFGSGGKVYAWPTSFIPAEDVAVQRDGKLVLAGTMMGPDGTDDFGVVRLQANGFPDTTFGSNGLVGISFDSTFQEMATSVVIQDDGKIVVAGSVQLGTAGWDFGIVRLHPNGTLDTTFSGGKVKVNVVPVNGGDDFAYDMIIQPDGKLVITGTTRPTPNNDIAIVRLTTVGTLDTTFNSGRIRIAVGNGNDDDARALLRQPDGKIVMAGSTAGDFCLIRLTDAGLIDSSFGFMGLVQTPVGSQIDRAYSVALQADGRIVAGGTANSGSFDEMAIVRYTTSGALDSTFDVDGKATFDVVPMASDILRTVLIHPSGKIIGVGASSGSYVLIRTTSTGGLDTTFGNAGKVIQNVAPSNSSLRKAILLPNGKIVAVGDGAGTSPPVGFTAARFLTEGAALLDFDFDGDQKDDIGIFRPAVAEWWVRRSSDGSTFAGQFGATGDRIVPGDYTGDDKSDLAVWRPSTGEWYVLRSEDFSYFAFQFGASGDLPVPSDYDLDHKADAAVFRPSTGTWFIQRSSGGTTIQGFGTNGDLPVPADYDGDSITDIAIFRPSAGQWWLNRSTLGIIVATFGTSTDKAVPGDYTGDETDDIAFWRPSTGEWFVLRSEDFSYFAFPFGISGDIPAPADYDGDGAVNPTVFRPSSATWFSARTTGTVIQAFGQTGDRPIPNAYVP